MAYRILTDEQEAALVAAYREGCGYPSLATRYGVSFTVVTGALRRAGVGPKRPRVVSSQRPGINGDDIVAAYLSGRSLRSITQEWHIGSRTLHNILSERSVALRPRLRNRDGHGNWNGGKSAMSGGYVRVSLPPDHPFAPQMRTSGGYCLEHRLVMAMHIGRPLYNTETVHHINGDRADNRIENLQLRHAPHGKGTVLRCHDCGSHNVVAVPLADMEQLT